MKITKEEKKQTSGITLVALVVTLVILLILAGITIATLFGDNGIINKAQKAKDETEQAEKDETAYLNKTEKDMKKAINGYGWKQNSDGSITDGEVTLKIGDYVDYNCKTNTETYTSVKEKTGHDNDQVFKASDYTYGWRVLGVDKDTKQLQLISEDFILVTGGINIGNRTDVGYRLCGQDGYVNGIEELNKICSIYGKGDGATSARIVNVDDINRITGYNPNNTGVKDPNQTGNGTKCYEGQLRQYGNNVSYRINSGKVEYKVESGSWTSSSRTTFTYHAPTVTSENPWKTMESETKTLKSTAYKYYPTTLNETNDMNATVGIESTSPEYKTLFTNSSTGADVANSGKDTYFWYWLGSSFVETSSGNAGFGLFNISGVIEHYSMYVAENTAFNPCYGVRPVISLDQKAQLKDSNTQKDGCKLYNLVIE